MPAKVILLGCGSFNPPTIMHLRMFEIARDYLHRLGNYVVIGGIVSPVHDHYKKNELQSSTHRCKMLQLALSDSDWIRLSDWECNQESWSTTKTVLHYHQNVINSIVNNDTNNNFSWVPNDLHDVPGPVIVKLVCGADLLESFSKPGLWSDEDIDAIVGTHGLVVITREGHNPQKFIYETDILIKYMNNIHIVTEWIKNDVSSTKIRRALRRSESVKYLLPDKVLNYIYQCKLYGAKSSKYIEANIYNNNKAVTPNTANAINNNEINDFIEQTNQLNNDKFKSRHPGQAVKILNNFLEGDQISNEKASLEQTACLL